MMGSPGFREKGINFSRIYSDEGECYRRIRACGGVPRWTVS
ncbi:MAG: hypothetical protein Ct9H300mP19_04340 [Dehalococcoidia bacterium]|nr:MAG: hypothetical protein Ct9H300mP19_04340 [Dehalococcoidia bacterium]